MPVRYVINRVKRFFVYRVLHIDDTPHRIALGLAIGVFITWTPTIGFQMLLTVALAWLLRANKAVGVPFVWISNPFTLLPIYGPNYLVGCWVLGQDALSLKFLTAAQSDGTWAERVHTWWSATWQVFWPLWVGSLVVGLFLGVLAYLATRFAVVRYREHWHRKHPEPPWKHHLPTRDGSEPAPSEPSGGASPPQSG